MEESRTSLFQPLMGRHVTDPALLALFIHSVLLYIHIIPTVCEHVYVQTFKHTCFFREELLQIIVPTDVNKSTAAKYLSGKEDALRIPRLSVQHL